MNRCQVGPLKEQRDKEHACVLLPQQRREASSWPIVAGAGRDWWLTKCNGSAQLGISRSGRLNEGQNGLEVAPHPLFDQHSYTTPLSLSLSVSARQLPSCYVLSSTCVEENSRLRSSAVQVCARAGGRELVVVPSCRLLPAVPTKRVRRAGKGMPESTLQLSVIDRTSVGGSGWYSVCLCLLRPPAVLQNHEVVVVSCWHVRHHRRRGGSSVALAPDAVPDMLQGQERGELSPSARDLHLHGFTQRTLRQFFSNFTLLARCCHQKINKLKLAFASPSFILKLLHRHIAQANALLKKNCNGYYYSMHAHALPVLQMATTPSRQNKWCLTLMSDSPVSLR